ncbi:MAG: phosphatase PAP2 family protein [Chloroflexi bacterium]|nr:phosphatase PAP2 family protein [Chloroflexota bacterium]
MVLAAVVLSAAAMASDRLPGDLAVTGAVQDWPFPGRTLSRAVRALTATGTVAGVGAAAAVALWLTGRKREATLFALGLVVIVVLQGALKDVVDRPRPDPSLVDRRAGFSSSSFPAGHVMSGTYLLGAAALGVVRTRAGARPARVAAVAALVALVVLNGIANVWMGVHWPSDVAGGFSWALAVLLPMGFATRRRQPV